MRASLTTNTTGNLLSCDLNVIGLKGKIVYICHPQIPLDEACIGPPFLLFNNILSYY